MNRSKKRGGKNRAGRMQPGTPRGCGDLPLSPRKEDSGDPGSASGMCPLADVGGWTLNQSLVYTSLSFHLLHEPFLTQNGIFLVASLSDGSHTEIFVVLAMYNMQEVKSGTKPRRHLY